MRALLRNLPERLTTRPSTGRWTFAAVYLLWTVAETIYALLVPSEIGSSGQLSTADVVFLLASLIYLGLTIAACIVILPDLARRIRSGNRQLHPRNQAMPRIQSRLYRILYGLSLYGSLPILFAIIGVLPSVVMSIWDSPFSQSVQDNGLKTGWVGGFFISLLASTEEIERWAVIVFILLAVKRFLPVQWQSLRVQWRWMWVAIVASSLLFGFEHVGEYPHFGWTTLCVLSVSGLMLAMYALVTRRILVAMVTHFIYDFLAATDVLNAIPDAVGTIVLLTAVGIFALWFVVTRRLRPYLKLSGETPSSHVQAAAVAAD